MRLLLILGSILVALQGCTSIDFNSQRILSRDCGGYNSKHSSRDWECINPGVPQPDPRPREAFNPIRNLTPEECSTVRARKSLCSVKDPGWCAEFQADYQRNGWRNQCGE